MQNKLDIKHSKIKNTGLLFEVLNKMLSEEVIKNSKPVAINLIKKYFHNTELGKEYQIFRYILTSNSLTESKANLVFDTLKESYAKLDLNKLAKEKYNLIKEIKQYYVNDDIFKFRVNNYNVLAAINNLLESFSTNKFYEPKVLTKHKTTILEHITSVPSTEKNLIVETFGNLTKDEQKIVFDLMIDKYNKRYKSLNVHQKSILREFVSTSNSPKFTSYINDKTQEIYTKLKLIEVLLDESENKENLKEVLSTVKPFSKNYVVKDEDVVKLLNLFELHEELENLK